MPNTSKEKNFDIIQTADGPMKRTQQRAPYGFYAAGIVCVLYACIFPLYRLSDFLFFAAVAVGAYLLGKKLSPVSTKLEPCEAEVFNTGNASVDEILTQGNAYLAQLRKANAALPDADISARLDRIESSCTRIFAYIKENPSQAPQIRKFMNYYLPTLLQLLKVQTELESQPVAGQNISNSKQRIVAMTGQVADAFDKFYDDLHADQSMNVNAEISVFETMLKQEGLLKDGDTMAAAPDTQPTLTLTPSAGGQH